MCQYAFCPICHSVPEESMDYDRWLDWYESQVNIDEVDEIIEGESI